MGAQPTPWGRGQDGFHYAEGDEAPLVYLSRPRFPRLCPERETQGAAAALWLPVWLLLDYEGFSPQSR